MNTTATVIPLKGRRGMTAIHMSKSLATAAQLTHHASADATQLLQEKKRLIDNAGKVSVEDLLIAAVVRALKTHPGANGRVIDNTIHLFDQIDISVAISLPDNTLVAPALIDVGSMSVLQISEARRDLVKRARANKVSVSEMTAGTFTLSNLGLSRVEHFTPIINLPQIAILGIGCMTERAVSVAEGEFDLRPYIGLSLTFDHRALDGAPAGDFLTTICDEVESTGKSS